MTTTKHLTDEEALAIFESGEGFEPVPGEYTPLGRILLARESRDRADALLTDAVAAGREAGLTWEQIGTGLAVTKEGARKRYHRVPNASAGEHSVTPKHLTEVDQHELEQQYAREPRPLTKAEQDELKQYVAGLREKILEAAEAKSRALRARKISPG